MSRSYESIDYRVRPAKAVERKMLCDAFAQLVHFHPLHQYRYVGFGSTYFSDFTIIHKKLGIDTMVSIEEDVQFKARFDFNKPYQCIEMAYGPASSILPTLTWTRPTILWLDYDRKASIETLGDISTFIENACFGSVGIVSVQVQPDPPKQRLESFKERFGDKVPEGIGDTDLAGQRGWAEANLTHRVINNEILEALFKRNGGLSEEDKLHYRPLFRFHYSDGAKMLTIGGVLVRTRDSEAFGSCAFETMPFVVPGTAMNAYEIRVPRLTLREIRLLDTVLPSLSPVQMTSPPIPQTDIDAYHKIYRYFPTFAEADLS